MDRLKKEWRETQIPQEVRLRARNRAWEKINHPILCVRRVAPAFAVCAIALAALFVIFWSGPVVQEEQAVSVAPSVVEESLGNSGDSGDYEDSGDSIAAVAKVDSGDNGDYEDSGDSVAAVAAAVTNVTNVARVPRVDNGDSGDNIVAAAAAVANVATVANVPRGADTTPVPRKTNDEPSRVVLNFILPESGARLIWIVSSNF